MKILFNNGNQQRWSDGHVTVHRLLSFSINGDIMQERRVNNWREPYGSTLVIQIFGHQVHQDGMGPGLLPIHIARLLLLLHALPHNHVDSHLKLTTIVPWMYLSKNQWRREKDWETDRQKRDTYLHVVKISASFGQETSHLGSKWTTAQNHSISLTLINHVYVMYPCIYTYSER